MKTNTLVLSAALLMTSVAAQAQTSMVCKTPYGNATATRQLPGDEFLTAEINGFRATYYPTSPDQYINVWVDIPGLKDTLATSLAFTVETYGPGGHVANKSAELEAGDFKVECVVTP